jgi:hypothetical protein
MATEDGVDLTGNLWDQLWAHSRHLETMRSQYLGFYFTAVLAVTAITAKDLADDELRTTGSLIAFSALTLGLVVLSGFLLLAVRRIGDVLHAYRVSVFELRDAYLRGAPGAELPGPSGSYWASTQGAAEAVLYSSLIFFWLALLAGAFRSSVVHGVTEVACWGAVGLGVVAVLACLYEAGLPKRRRAG